MGKKVNYTEYCIAYMDILGFKNIVNIEESSNIHEIFSNVRLAKKLVTGDRKGKDIFCGIRRKTKFYFFSDSIVCAIPVDEPMALEMVTSNCMLLQHALWLKGIPVWLRGGVTIGKLYCGQSEVFGPALVEAYTIEDKIAKYPRIVMTEEIYKHGIRNSADKQDIIFITKTEDDLRMVECFKTFRIYENKFNELIESIEKNIREITDLHIQEKYIWIKNKYQDVFDETKLCAKN